ncbi:MAG: phosphoribosylamine--glycine ligase [Chlamydiae bacterium]|nr:MAG: phosphoribosylamine--glycine ligase [Chlamydiota bacterium]
MNVLIIGSGGREHAIAYKVKKSIRVKKIFCTPGNAGILNICEPVPVPADDYSALAKFAEENNIGLTIVGPEVPLCAGIVNEFHNRNLQIFGPDKKGAQLEGSKVFAKRFMQKYGIPTANFKCFDNQKKALDYINEKNIPLVVKADGLAAGKGVIVCKSNEEAKQAVKLIMEDKTFGDAGRQLLIEDMLYGEEASILALTDGKIIVPLETSQDHKAAYDGDRGPNTGGMGAYSPAPVVTPGVMEKINRKVLKPALDGLKAEGMDFHGVLYAGLMIQDAKINVLEFNVRFGDPETQAVLPRLKTDFVDLCLATATGKLSSIELKWDNRPAVCVVMASGGYPGKYHKHLQITGIEDAEKNKDVIIFHSGTDLRHGELVTNGGRVLGVTALGDNLSDAIETAYQAVEKIHFDQMHFRWDIGAKALN